jgi:IS30 family transposase
VCRLRDARCAQRTRSEACTIEHLPRSPPTRRHEHYRAMRADFRAWKQTRRPKQCLLARNERLRQLVAHKLQIDRSPQQISAWLEIAYADDETMRMLHGTICLPRSAQLEVVLDSLV